jgi:hypothetical protein
MFDHLGFQVRNSNKALPRRELHSRPCHVAGGRDEEQPELRFTGMPRRTKWRPCTDYGWESIVTANRPRLVARRLTRFSDG